MLDGITSNVWGYDSSSSNVGEGEDGVSRCGVESNDVEVVLDGVRGLITIVFMLFAIVVILLVVIVLKWTQPVLWLYFNEIKAFLVWDEVLVLLDYSGQLSSVEMNYSD